MTIDELREKTAKNKAQGLECIMLVIPRGAPPRSEFIRVRGLGKGRVLNAGEHADGTWAILAQFDLATVEAALAKHDALAQPPTANKERK